MQNSGMGRSILRLKELRLEKGRKDGLPEGKVLSQEEVAAQVGISSATISRHERGKTWPDESDFLLYSKYYKVHPAELFAGVTLCPPETKELVATYLALSRKDRAFVDDMVARIQQSSVA